MALGTPLRRLRSEDVRTAAELRRSATSQGVTPDDRFDQWWAQRSAAGSFAVDRVAFHELRGWHEHPATGDLRHDSGQFFQIGGLAVETDHGPVGRWAQPIITQPEIGVLGILVKSIGGVLHCLMQAKMEPGNVNLVQLSPTVQATRSNYTRVHRGSPIRYLEHFTGARRGRVLVDSIQSEQGSWFYRKRNRNIVVETEEDVPVHEDFLWLTVGQVVELLRRDDVVNMDARTVLSCMPIAATGEGALHTTGEVLSWLTEIRSRYTMTATAIPLREVPLWRRGADEIYREDRKYFSIQAVSVRADTREVPGWTQPLLVPHHQGVAAFLARRIEGRPHVLVQARMEPGYVNGAELAPTVQCMPANYTESPHRPRYLDEVLAAGPDRILFDTVLSEEGGRFFHARNRYLVVEVPDDFPLAEPEDYRWLTVDQLTELVRHSHYVNVQARTLLACLHSLW
jgi:oxidase EvaA